MCHFFLVYTWCHFSLCHFFLVPFFPVPFFPVPFFQATDRTNLKYRIYRKDSHTFSPQVPISKSHLSRLRLTHQSLKRVGHEGKPCIKGEQRRPPCLSRQGFLQARFGGETPPQKSVTPPRNYTDFILITLSAPTPRLLPPPPQKSPSTLPPPSKGEILQETLVGSHCLSWLGGNRCHQNRVHQRPGYIYNVL